MAKFQAHVDRTGTTIRKVFSTPQQNVFFQMRLLYFALMLCSTIFFFTPKCWQSVLFNIETFIPAFSRFYQYRRLVVLYCIICFGIHSSAKFSKSFTDFLLYYLFVAAFGDFGVV